MIEEYDEKQQKEINRLIKNECANCQDGNWCIPLDMPCPQLTSLHLYCKYFVKSVLPINKTLECEITKNYVGTKKCKMCGKVFVSSSNRQMYCPICGEKNKSQQSAKRMSKMRH